MPTLTRRPGETIILGDEVSITVLSISGNQVKFGAVAPKTVLIHRKELYEKIQQEGSDTPCEESDQS